MDGLYREVNSNSVRRINEFKNKLGGTYVRISIFFMLLIIIFITYFVASKGLATFYENRINILDYLFGTHWSPNASMDEGGPQFGILPFLVGSFSVTILAVLISTPLSVGAAIFMAEISPKTGRRFLQPVIELLVGIPSVVYGYTGLSLIVPMIRRITGELGFSLAAGTLVLSVMILPTITSVSYDALMALSKELKNASYALGATRWQTIYKVLVPTALPNILTGVVLGMARAFGEALAVQMVIGNVQRFPKTIFDSTSTLTSILTLEMGNTVAGSVYNNALWSMALILLLMSFLFITIIRTIGKGDR